MENKVVNISELSHEQLVEFINELSSVDDLHVELAERLMIMLDERDDLLEELSKFKPEVLDGYSISEWVTRH